MKLFSVPAVLAVLLLVCISCERDKNGNRIQDSTTSGKIKVAVDESLKPVIDAEKDTFEALYTNAHIDLVYASEEDAMNLLLNDSVRIAILTRQLLPQEDELFKKKMLEPQQVTAAKEGIAIIVNKNNPDSVLSSGQLKDILDGKIKTWNQLNPKASKQPVQVVFDKPNSGIYRYMDSLGIEGKCENCFAVQDNPGVIKHIEANPNAIGLIGVSWISDRDDPSARAFLSGIRVVGITGEDGETYQPFQGEIAQGKYLLTRKIIMINPEGRAGLGSGFIAFINGEKGQRIILKAGLVPTNSPIRIVNIKRAPL